MTVSKDQCAFIFRVKQFQKSGMLCPEEEGTMILERSLTIFQLTLSNATSNTAVKTSNLMQVTSYFCST
jgi:hypothetical protein